MMTFMRLGTTNARRNLARSIFAILSMAVAAGFLTYSISLSRGYTQLYKADARSVIGGEIIAYARQFGGIIPEGESKWQHAFLDESPFTDLETFHPELLSSGYLNTGQQQSRFSAEDMENLATALPDLSYLYPRYQIPAVTVDQNRRDTPLRGRDLQLDLQLTRHPAELLQEGRWFTAEDEGAMVAVVSKVQELPTGSVIPATGATLRIEVPRLVYIDGEPTFLHGETIPFEFDVVGQILAVTRRVDSGSGDAPVYWQLPEVQIPLGTWEKIWQEIGGRDYQPEQISLGYSDLSFLEDTVLELRTRFPNFSVYSVAEHFQQAERRGLIELLTDDLRELVVTEDTQSAMPLDLRLPFTVMIFVNAALVVAANLLIMVNERKTEIGILKSVGSQRGQVLLMILAEALIISLVGATVGFIFFRIPATLNQLTNGLGLLTILQSIVRDGVTVYGASFLFAVIFGLLPGLRTANLSVMEVLRND